MKFNANVILFLFASTKTIHVNGTSLRISYKQSANEGKTNGKGMETNEAMKDLERTPTDDYIVHHADASSVKLLGDGKDASTHHGSTSSSTTTSASSVPKKLAQSQKVPLPMITSFIT